MKNRKTGVKGVAGGRGGVNLRGALLGAAVLLTMGAAREAGAACLPASLTTVVDYGNNSDVGQTPITVSDTSTAMPPITVSNDSAGCTFQSLSLTGSDDPPSSWLGAMNLTNIYNETYTVYSNGTSRIFTGIRRINWVTAFAKNGPNGSFTLTPTSSFNYNSEPKLLMMRAYNDANVDFGIYLQLKGSYTLLAANIDRYNSNVTLPEVSAGDFIGPSQPVADKLADLAITVTTLAGGVNQLKFNGPLNSAGHFRPLAGADTGVGVCVYDTSTSACVDARNPVTLPAGASQQLLPYKLAYVSETGQVKAGNIAGTITMELTAQ